MTRNRRRASWMAAPLAALCLLLLAACASSEGVTRDELGTVKPATTRADIEEVLKKKPVREARRGDYTLVQYPYALREVPVSRGAGGRYLAGGAALGAGGGAAVVGGACGGGGRGRGGKGEAFVGLMICGGGIVIGAAVLVIGVAGGLVAEIVSAIPAESGTGVAGSGAKDANLPTLTIIYGPTGRAEWVGNAPVGLDRYLEARQGAPAAQLEVAKATLSEAEQWRWTCRSANQGHGPAVTFIADRGPVDRFQKFMLARLAAGDSGAAAATAKPEGEQIDRKLVRVVGWVEASIDRSAICDPDTADKLNIPQLNVVGTLEFSDLSVYRSASCGDANAQDNLGFEFNMGKGRPENPVEAYFWYGLAQRRAGKAPERYYADLKRDTVRRQLTPELVQYVDGLVATWKPDPERCAPPWNSPESAVTHAGCGSAGAQDWLGLRYQKGKGVRRDPLAAYVWYGLAQKRAKTPYDRLFADHQRGKVRAGLTPDQIADGDRRIAAFKADESACKIEYVGLALPPELQAAAQALVKPQTGPDTVVISAATSPVEPVEKVKPAAAAPAIELVPGRPFENFKRLPKGDLTAEQVERVISGARFASTGTPASREYYVLFGQSGSIEGELFYQRARNTFDDGAWRIRGGLLCIRWMNWDGGAENCYRVVSIHSGLYLIHARNGTSRTMAYLKN